MTEEEKKKEEEKRRKEEKKRLETVFKELWKIGLTTGFKVIMDQSGEYESAQKISNSRFGLRPTAVALPKTANHIRVCLQFCKDKGVKFRIRSGGHQHEGMSSLTDGLMIRLSEMNQIVYEDETLKRAWIPVGKPLKDIYDELQLHGKTIPGGGCSGVNVGGLALGGGWGTSIRKMGFTCDNFDQAEVVLANGEIVQARADNDYKDLFWALRGGGGGNFGVVTRFLFRLSDIGPKVSSCRIQWEMPKDAEGKAKMLELIKLYMKEQADFPRELTTVMSFRVEHKDMDTYHPIAIVGKYYGDVKKLKELMAPFTSMLAPDDEGTVWNPKPKKEEALDKIEEAPHDFGWLSDLINDFVDGYTIGDVSKSLMDKPAEGIGEYTKKSPPGVTCLKPLPHKISSGYPKNTGVYDELAEKMFERIQQRDRHGNVHDGVRLYMVLHGLPGKLSNVKSADSAYYFRDKEFLVQFQAWWQDPGFGSETKFKNEWAAYRKDEKEYVRWINKGLQELSDLLEGGFINFVDKEIPLEEYYKGNFDRLKEVKKKYDPKNCFKFPMSIPVD